MAEIPTFCPQCPFRKSAWDHDTYKQAQAFRQHVKSSTHSNYGLGKYFWNCEKCGKSYNRSEQFENHPCERLKRRESDEPAVKYVRKDNQKKIHRMNEDANEYAMTRNIIDAALSDSAL